MQTIKAGQAAALTVALQDDAGNALQPASVRWRLLDAEGVEIAAWAAVAGFAAGTSSAAISLTPLQTTIPAGETVDARVIELELTWASGLVQIIEELVTLKSNTLIIVGENSFQTFIQASIRGLTMQGVDGWSAATRNMQELALIEAYNRICKLNILTNYEATDSQNIITDGSLPRIDRLTAVQISRLEAKLLQAIYRAQIFEADDILSGDEVMRARQSGLISMTVGESSQFFRTSKPLNLPVNSRAMAELGKYVRWGASLGRA